MAIEAADVFEPGTWEQLFRAARDVPRIRPRIPSHNEEGDHGFPDKRELWDARAAGFAQKKRGPYASLLLAMLRERAILTEGASVLDIGCGPGTLAVPLAVAGHRVVGVDFSKNMLAQLAQAAGAAGVQVETIERSWQDSWEGIPCADLAISSRSFAVDDLADGIAKIESHARRYAVATLPVGDNPWFDTRLRAALGREVVARRDGEFVALVNYLWALGRRPRIEYIELERTWAAADIEELREVLAQIVEPRTPEEAGLLARYIEEHAAPVEGGIWLDYEQHVYWGVVMWEPPAGR